MPNWIWPELTREISEIFPYLAEVKMIKVQRLFHGLAIPDKHEKVEFELEMEFGKHENIAISSFCSFVLKVRDLSDHT